MLKSPELILKEAISEAAMAILRQNNVSDTYVAEQASAILDKGVAHDLLAHHLANEVRIVLGMPTRSASESDGISNESITEYYRRQQG